MLHRSDQISDTSVDFFITLNRPFSMSLRLLSLLLSRAGAPLSMTSSNNCRFINGGTKPWMGQRRRPEERNEEFEGDLEDEGDVEDKLQALLE